MKAKTKKIKLRPRIFLEAYHVIYKLESFYTCNAIHRAMDRNEGGPERKFYEKLFGIPDRATTFGMMVEELEGFYPLSVSLQELRLMALALAYNLAHEHNLGSFKL